VNWGDVPAWVALVLAASAGVVAVLARRDSKVSAAASVRSAAAAEESLALQRAEAEERHQAAQPRPEFRLERQGSNAYILRNVGTGPARNVQILDEGLPAMRRRLPVPDGTTLAREAGYSFVIAGAMGSRFPTHVMVTCDELAEPVAVSIPRYP
jgi:hypothetical protein